MVIDALWAVNPGVTKRALTAGLRWIGNTDAIAMWDLQKLGNQSGRGGGLRKLPDEFGALHIRGDLCLNGNSLVSLPATFASIPVGGSIYLSDNQLASLPDNIGSITVGGGLYLSRNKLKQLPESCSSLCIGSTLALDENELAMLPAGMDSAMIGGDLILYGNHLEPSSPQDLPNVRGRILNFKPERRVSAAEMGLLEPTLQRVDSRPATAKPLGLGRRRTFGQAARAIAAASRIANR